MCRRARGCTTRSRISLANALGTRGAMTWGMVARIGLGLLVAMAWTQGVQAQGRARLVVRREVLLDDDGNPKGTALGVAARGLPAVSADGQTAVGFAQFDDWGHGELRFIDTRTGDVIRELAWPQAYDPDDGTPEAIDRKALRRINRVLARGGYRALDFLANDGSREVEDASTITFAGHGLSVTQSLDYTPEQGAAPSALSVTRDGAHLLDAPYDDERELHSVAYAADRSFILVTQAFCGCHCSTWPTLYPLSLAGE